MRFGLGLLHRNHHDGNMRSERISKQLQEPISALAIPSRGRMSVYGDPPRGTLTEYISRTGQGSWYQKDGGNPDIHYNIYGERMPGYSRSVASSNSNFAEEHAGDVPLVRTESELEAEYRRQVKQVKEGKAMKYSGPSKKDLEIARKERQATLERLGQQMPSPSGTLNSTESPYFANIQSQYFSENALPSFPPPVRQPRAPIPRNTFPRECSHSNSYPEFMCGAGAHPVMHNGSIISRHSIPLSNFGSETTDDYTKEDKIVYELPIGWSRHWHAERRTHFYIDDNTGKFQWEVPENSRLIDNSRLISVDEKAPRSPIAKLRQSGASSSNGSISSASMGRIDLEDFKLPASTPGAFPSEPQNENVSKSKEDSNSPALEPRTSIGAQKVDEKQHELPKPGLATATSQKQEGKGKEKAASADAKKTSAPQDAKVSDPKGNTPKPSGSNATSEPTAPKATTSTAGTSKIAVVQRTDNSVSKVSAVKTSTSKSCGPDPISTASKSTTSKETTSKPITSTTEASKGGGTSAPKVNGLKTEATTPSISESAMKKPGDSNGISIASKATAAKASTSKPVTSTAEASKGGSGAAAKVNVWETEVSKVGSSATKLNATKAGCSKPPVNRDGTPITSKSTTSNPATSKPSASSTDTPKANTSNSKVGVSKPAISKAGDPGSKASAVKENTSKVNDSSPKAGGTSKPAASNSTTSKTTTSKAAGADSKTTISTAKPSGSVSKPVTSTAKPSGSVSKPVTSTAKPSGSVSKPVTSTAKPSGSVSKPTTSTAKPSGSVSKPVTSTAKPSGSVSKPTTSPSEPINSNPKPATPPPQPSTTAVTNPSTKPMDPSASDTITSASQNGHDEQKEPTEAAIKKRQRLERDLDRLQGHLPEHMRSSPDAIEELRRLSNASSSTSFSGEYAEEEDVRFIHLHCDSGRYPLFWRIKHWFRRTKWRLRGYDTRIRGRRTVAIFPSQLAFLWRIPGYDSNNEEQNVPLAWQPITLEHIGPINGR